MPRLGPIILIPPQSRWLCLQRESPDSGESETSPVFSNPPEIRPPRSWVATKYLPTPGTQLLNAPPTSGLPPTRGHHCKERLHLLIPWCFVGSCDWEKVELLWCSSAGWLGLHSDFATKFVCKGYLNKIFCHKLGDSEVKSGVLEVSSLKSQYWFGHLPQKVLQEDPALPLPGSGTQRFLGMGQSTSNFCLCLHVTVFCVSVSIAPFFMRT